MLIVVSVCCTVHQQDALNVCNSTIAFFKVFPNCGILKGANFNLTTITNNKFRKEKNKIKVKHTRHPVINVNFLLKKTKLVFRLTSNTMSSL